MLFANRIGSSTSCSIWLPETSPPSSSRGLLRHRFQSCNTSFAVSVAGSNRTHAFRSGRTQRRLQFFIDDGLDGGPNPLPHQLLERAFSLPPAPAIHLHGVILRHPPPSGRELWLNSPDLDAFSLFHQLRDTTPLYQGTISLLEKTTNLVRARAEFTQIRGS